MQDDYLDAFGDPLTFGKQVGGDIIENKKTYLYLKAIEFADADVKAQLKHLFFILLCDIFYKIEKVKALFDHTGSSEATKQAIEEFIFKAFETLEKMQIEADKKTILRAFGENLMGRKV